MWTIPIAVSMMNVIGSYLHEICGSCLKIKKKWQDVPDGIILTPPLYENGKFGIISNCSSDTTVLESKMATAYGKSSLRHGRLSSGRCFCANHRASARLLMKGPVYKAG
jgi:hypothetical protein